MVYFYLYYQNYFYISEEIEVRASKNSFGKLLRIKDIFLILETFYLNLAA